MNNDHSVKNKEPVFGGLRVQTSLGGSVACDQDQGDRASIMQAGSLSEDRIYQSHAAAEGLGHDMHA